LGDSTVLEEKLRNAHIEEGASGQRVFKESDMLPLSRLPDIEFCERRAALHLIEMVWKDNIHTAEGSVMHERVHGDDTPENRGDLIIVRGLRLRSLRLGLCGKADVVELHRSGDNNAMGGSVPGHSGRWIVYPVEYKPGRVKKQRSFQIQLCAQAMCLEEMLDCVIPCGALFHGKTRRRQDVEFDMDLRKEVEDTSARLHELVASGVTPKAVYGDRCKHCSLCEFCMPKIMASGRSAKDYLLRALTGQ